MPETQGKKMENLNFIKNDGLILSQIKAEW